MQILINQLKDLYDYDLSEGKRNWTILAGIELAQALLEKEKEAIMNAYDIGWSNGNKGQDLNDLYYNETFNTNEKPEETTTIPSTEWFKVNGTVTIINDNLVPFHTVCGCEVCGCTMGSKLVAKDGVTTTITSTNNL